VFKTSGVYSSYFGSDGYYYGYGYGYGKREKNPEDNKKRKILGFGWGKKGAGQVRQSKP